MKWFDGHTFDTLMGFLKKKIAYSFFHLLRSLHIKSLKFSSEIFACWKINLHTASETFDRHKKFRSGSIFCVFASVAFILIGKDEESDFFF